MCAGLYDESGHLVEDPTSVLRMQQQFYQKLYSSDESVNFNLKMNIPNKVEKEMTAADSSQFTVEEFSEALKSLKNGSCPGSDGLSTEFYKVFWTRIKQEVYAAMIYSYDHASLLCESSKTGILNLIPKGQKDTRFLKNLRPITLLNTDYKIVEKSIANRMVPALQYIIHEDQKGFLPNRRIAANIRKILDVVTECEQGEDEGLILSCDYLKCFDRIEHTAVIGAMQAFNFSSVLIQWVKTIYHGFRVRVQNNGNFSEDIDIQRSVRQGGPASNCLFLTVAELLAIMIREDEKIEGITLRTILHLLNQYADDMDVCSKYKQESLDHILQKIKTFHDHTGFQLSYDKTVLYRVGAMTKARAELYTAEGIKWTDEKINILGVDIYAEEDMLLKTNYNAVMEKVEAVVSSWKKRNLSLLGKVNVLNTLVASLFVYKMTVLPRIPKEYVDKLNSIMNSFLWNGKKPKISLKTLQMKKEHGGCSLVDFACKDSALKCTWVKMLFEGMYPIEFVHKIIQEDMGRYIWCANLSPGDVKKVTDIRNTFWRDVLTAWCEYHFEPELEKTAQFLWWNSHIRVAGRPIFWKVPFRKGLLFVHDLIEKGQFISDEKAWKNFSLTTLQYNTLKSAIPREFTTVAKSSEVDIVFTDNKFRDFMKSEHSSQCAYQELIMSSPQYEKLSVKWLKECVLSMDQIQKANREIKKVTSIVKYRSFQYRMLNRAIVTNVQLFKWKIKRSPQCSFCQAEIETYKHLFYDCLYAKEILQTAEKIVLELFPDAVCQMEFANIVLNDITAPVNHASNFIFLCAKQYIYGKRCLNEKPSTVEFRKRLYQYKNIEKYYAVKNNAIIKYVKRWEPTEVPKYTETICNQIAELS